MTWELNTALGEGAGYWQWAGAECLITIEARPHYCDRGRWIAKLHDLRGRLAMDIDHSDGWPRYFFDLDRAKAECEAWLTRRGQMPTERR